MSVNIVTQYVLQNICTTAIVKTLIVEAYF